MKLLLSVIDPSYDYQLNVLGSSARRLVETTADFAKKNGLYHAFLLGLDVEKMPSNLQVDRKQAEQELEEFKKGLYSLNEILNGIEAEYALIKICNTVVHVPRDIDVLVKPEQRSKVITALRNAGYVPVQKSVTETSFVKKTVRVDLYTEITYMSATFIDTAFMLNSRTTQEMLKVRYPGLSDETSFLVMAIHSLLGHRSVSLLDLVHLRHLRARTNMAACRSYAQQKGWGLVFDLILEKLDLLGRQTYEADKPLVFPYFFDRAFVIGCINTATCMKPTKRRSMMIELSLMSDQTISRSIGSPLYNLIIRSPTTRYLVNSLTAWFKSERGDKKSVSVTS